MRGGVGRIGPNPAKLLGAHQKAVADSMKGAGNRGRLHELVIWMWRDSTDRVKAELQHNTLVLKLASELENILNVAWLNEESPNLPTDPRK